MGQRGRKTQRGRQPEPELPAQVSIVVPVHNDARALARLLADLNPLPPRWEVVVVRSEQNAQGESASATVDLPGVRSISAPRGRGTQQCAGVAESRGRLLWFVHADTRVPARAVRSLADIARRWSAADDLVWGRFDVRLTPDSRLLRTVARAMSWRSRWWGICTGDQGIFVSRRLLERVGGFPDQPLMEDIELSKRLRAWQAPLCLRVAIGASSRRWRRQGVAKTILSMWHLRLRYYLGAPPEVLVRLYYP